MGGSEVRGRVGVLRELLERLDEYVVPGVLEGLGGTGESAALMPVTYTASVKEVERLLRVMRDDRSSPLLTTDGGVKWIVDGQPVSVRRLWWHVRAWYVDCDRSPRAPRRVAVAKGARRQLVALPVDDFERPLPQRGEPRRDRAARVVLADAGLAWIAERWAGPGSAAKCPAEPMLPFVHGRRGYDEGCRCLDCETAGRKAAA